MPVLYLRQVINIHACLPAWLGAGLEPVRSGKNV